MITMYRSTTRKDKRWVYEYEGKRITPTQAKLILQQTINEYILQQLIELKDSMLTPSDDPNITELKIECYYELNGKFHTTITQSYDTITSVKLASNIIEMSLPPDIPAGKIVSASVWSGDFLIIKFTRNKLDELEIISFNDSCKST